MIKQLFPFEYVPKGSRVIIYGYGDFGRSYISQIKETNWCNIIGVLDKKYDKLETEKLLDFDICKESDLYDYIVVAVSDLSVGRDIIDLLERQGVQREHIVFYHDRHKKLISEDKTDKIDEDELTVLLVGSGGMGDGIMDTAFYKRLIEIVPNVIIDIYGEPFLNFIYGAKKNVRKIYDRNKIILDYSKYDLVIVAGWGIDIKYCKYGNLKNKSERLYNLVIKTESEKLKCEETSKIGVRAFRIKEAQINNKDRFWMMGYGKLWNLSSDMMELDLNSKYLDEFKDLCLKRYVTINYGADMRLAKNPNDTITKTWPVEYYEKFIKKFKIQYPHIQVVQLGGSDSIKIKGTDYCFLGKPLELSEYIIEKSLLHVDCEGGLVHMATALGTKCVVLFGPTPMDIFAYKQNINICAETCKECFEISKDWSVHCVNRSQFKKCMYSITPDMVLGKISGYMYQIEKVNENIVC
jgi:ADP-heptose:LPS heptosyltransferase